MKKIFNLLICLVVFVSLTSCGPLNRLFHKEDSNDPTVVAGSIQNMYQTNHEYTAFQVDSMCVADTLPRNFEGWIRRTYSDYETNAYVVRYAYIKVLNENCELMYIVTPRGDVYIVSKRKVVTEEE